MNLVIVTGMSGAGKTKAVNALEDLGYYCVDNMPPQFLLSFVQLQEINKEGGARNNAVVIDARSQDTFADFLTALDTLRAEQTAFRLLFLDAEPAVLLQRYQESRRKHPLLDASHPSLQDAISRDRTLLAAVRAQADLVIDTSCLLPMQLKERIAGLFNTQEGASTLVQCLSFGFKNGLPADADLVFDVRCLPNPFYVPALKHQTGLDAPVMDYVAQWPQTQTLWAKLTDLLAFLLPLYIAEGKSQLTIAIGCTGGKHRSVATAAHLGDALRAQGIPVCVTHRDIDK
ncbi:MAG: RNase adapter RapZ [Clostridia bacterium]